jgi:DNA-binding CsgD family transcriptional regulator
VGLFGREPERDRLAQLLEEGGSGPSGMLLQSAPGLGKSTLWRDTVTRARDRGWCVLCSAPGEPDRELAFSGLGDLFDEIAEESLQSLPGPQRRALSAALYVGDAKAAPEDPGALPRATLGALRRLGADAPLLIAIDDEQWLDPPSRRVLGFALSRLRDDPVCVLVTRRTDTDDGLWPALGRAAYADRLSSIALQPLDERAIGRLIAEQMATPQPLPTVRRIHRAAGGNPLYALAIARELAASLDVTADEVPIPATLMDAMSRRLADLAPETREPLLVAAACSDPSPALIASIVPGFSEVDLEGAVAAQIIEPDSDRVRFTHPLLASACYSMAAPSRRRAIHRSLAAALEGSAEAHAHHLALGAEQPDERVAEVLDGAAGDAARRGAPEVAASLLEHAARLTPADDEEALRLRRVTAAELHHASGDAPRARSALESLLAELPGGELRARALLTLARLRFDDYQVSSDLAEQAVSHAGDDHRTAAQAESLLGELCGNQGDRAGARRHARAATERAERTGDMGLVAQMLAQRGLHAFFGGDGVQEELMARAVALEDAADRITSYYMPSCTLGLELLWSDQLERARPLLERSLRRAVQRGEESDREGLLFHLAHLEWESGRLDAARPYMSAFVEATRQLVDEQAGSYLLWLQAFIAERRGELDEAARWAEQATDLATRIGDTFIASFASAILATVEIARGDPGRAHERLAPIRAALLGDGGGFIGSLTLDLWTTDVDALVAAGRLDEALETLAEMEGRTSSSGNPHAVAVHHRSQGLVLAARGEVEPALASLHLAVAEHARRPIPFALGRTLLEQGTVQRRARRKRDANRSLQQALAVLEPLEAGLLVARARDELSRIGLRRAAADAGLTAAQRRVAELVVAGMSNREIAGTLYMSQRTVETHLTKVYRELGIRSRAQLASALAQRPAGDPAP